jgi:E3 ubiquitin-protein ligase SHPRH
MGRATATSRGRGPLPSANYDLPGQYSSSSNLNAPLNERDSSPASTGTVSERRNSLPELRDELIEFISQQETVSEPPRKRQKMMLERNMAGGVQQDFTGKEPELKHIIVKRSTWDIKLAGSKLSSFETPIIRNNIRLYVSWTRNCGPQYIEVWDNTSRHLFHAPLPEDKSGFEDVLLALEVDHESNKWAKDQGRLWTEFGVGLLRKNGSDFLKILFTIKWNITASPYDIAQFTGKTKALSKVLTRYLPDTKVTKGEKWTPQDFYQSVHTPVKNDDVSSMRVDELESDLHPFQKRAVQWLLRKEGVEWSVVDCHVNPFLGVQKTVLPNSFIQATDAEGRKCYISHLFGLVTLDVTAFATLEEQLKGGILAEEMGLGKTVELISLITLHKRRRDESTNVFDTFTGEHVRPTSATLIIAPPSILQQWKSEINRHAPYLKVMHYEGIKAHGKMKASELLESLATSDVVLSTYPILAAEIHFTHLNPEKKLRRESKYPRPKSALMCLQWWRVCIDEAQMIESGVSNAAVVARMIPRVNAWCITGTPVRKDVNDLLGLLIFLRYEPYASIKHIWSDLISSHKQEFHRLFGSLALRHSKQYVRDELRLPAQRRYVITMPFTPIEEQHYQELFNQMCDVCGLDAQGAPLTDTWDPDKVSDIMRTWLVRLRQTALHPEVGGRNRRALGHKDGPLRTVDQVLVVMIDQTDVAIRTDQRTLLTTKLKRGQLYENSPRVKEALDIWEQAVIEASEIVKECREQLQQEIERNEADGNSQGKRSPEDSGKDSDSDSSDEQEE